MKNYSWILVAAAMAPLVPLACSSETGTTSTSAGGSGGRGETTTTGSNTTGSNTTGSSSSSGAGGAEPVDCTGIFDENDCGACAEASCCQELFDCNEDGECLDCIFGNGDPAACAANAASKKVLACLNMSCNAECFTPPPPCNPVTGAGCDVANGATCDLLQDSGFVCFDPPNTAILCGACNNSAGPFCGAGLGCFGGLCAHYCCTDTDCGTGKCDTAAGGQDGVGVCISATDKTKPSCDAPKTSPSMGSCFMPGGTTSSAASSSAASSSAASSSAASSSAASTSAASSSAASTSAASTSAASSSAASTGSGTGGSGAGGSSSSTGP